MNNLDTWIKRGFEHYLAKDFERLDNIHYGRIGVIIGNGSSAKDFDYSLLDHPAIVSFAIEDAGCEPDKLSPDFWVFNTASFADRVAGGRDKSNTSGATATITNKRFFNHGPFNEEYPQDFPRRVYVFEKYSSWNSETNEIYREDSSISLALYSAWKVGIRKIVLVGIDACDISGIDYDPEDPLDNICLEYEDMRISYKHMQMIEDVSSAKIRYDKSNLEYEIYQSSLISPLSCFPKKEVGKCLIGWGLERRSDPEVIASY